MELRMTLSKLLILVSLLLLVSSIIACGGTAPEQEASQQPAAPAAESAQPAQPSGQTGQSASAAPAAPPAATPSDASAPAATATPQVAAMPSGPVEAKVDRLRIGFTVPPKETNLPWTGPRSLLTQLSPMVETLLDIDPDTGEYLPMLATRWEMAPDGMSWTVDLREGVVFHSDFGGFDAKDVAHTRELLGPQEGNLNTFRDVWANKVESVEVVDDYTVIFRLSKPDPNLDFFLSLSGDLVMLSKNQWEQVGQEGLEQNLVGTGPLPVPGTRGWSIHRL